MTLASDETALPLHRRSLEFEAFDTGGTLRIVGRLSDERPWADGGRSPAVLHDMELEVIVSPDDLTITSARAEIGTFPHHECSGIAEQKLAAGWRPGSGPYPAPPVRDVNSAEGRG